MAPKTTWEDLVQLGKNKRDIYVKLNGVRGNTMKSESGLHLNEGICDTYGWYCYNIIKGQVSKFSSSPISRETTTVIRTWDNTSGSVDKSPPDETIVKDTVQTVTLTTTGSAKIKLDRSDIIVENIAGSGKSLTVGSETKKDAEFKAKEQIKYGVSITVKAGEKVELLQTETEKGENAVYHVPYGTSSSNNWIGTDGDQYDGHGYWCYSFNHFFDDPTPFIELKGTSKKTSFTFVLKHTGTSGAEANFKYFSLKGDVLDSKFISDDGTPRLNYDNVGTGF